MSHHRRAQEGVLDARTTLSIHTLDAAEVCLLFVTSENLHFHVRTTAISPSLSIPSPPPHLPLEQAETDRERGTLGERKGEGAGGLGCSVSATL